MKKFALAAAAALTAGAFGLAAIAQDTTGTDFTKADGNKDNLVSYEEALGVYATLTQDLFNKADANADGNLDEAEFTALQGLTAGVDAGTTETSVNPPAPTNDTSSSSSAQ